jgi:hypothetical protein
MLLSFVGDLVSVGMASVVLIAFADGSARPASVGFAWAAEGPSIVAD